MDTIIHKDIFIRIVIITVNQPIQRQVIMVVGIGVAIIVIAVIVARPKLFITLNLNLFLFNYKKRGVNSSAFGFYGKFYFIKLVLFQLLFRWID